MGSRWYMYIWHMGSRWYKYIWHMGSRWYKYIWHIGSRWYKYTGCPRRNVPDFGRMFLMLNYTDITQNTYIQS